MQASQNYDAEELAKFAKLASLWWDTTGDLKTLHQINPIRLSYILEKTHLASQKVIDIGCGGGILSESMALQGANVTGIDMNQSLIDIAKLHQFESGMNVQYLSISAEEIANARREKFDFFTFL